MPVINTNKNYYLGSWIPPHCLSAPQKCSQIRSIGVNLWLRLQRHVKSEEMICTVLSPRWYWFSCKAEHGELHKVLHVKEPGLATFPIYVWSEREEETRAVYVQKYPSSPTCLYQHSWRHVLYGSYFSLQSCWSKGVTELLCRNSEYFLKQWPRYKKVVDHPTETNAFTNPTLTLAKMIRHC